MVLPVKGVYNIHPKREDAVGGLGSQYEAFNLELVPLVDLSLWGVGGHASPSLFYHLLNETVLMQSI